MNKIHILYLLVLSFVSCTQKEHADVLFFNAKVVTCDSVNSTASSFVIRDGKFIESGHEKLLLKKYIPNEKVDLNWKYVYPGFNDAHAHFYGLGMLQQSVDLTHTKSWNEVIERCREFQGKNKQNYITGRGWDQNDWESKNYPQNDELNKLFPAIPVLLKRVDGHAAIANEFLINLAHLTHSSKINGGEFVLKNGRLTGVLIDNAIGMVSDFLPKPTIQDKVKALMDAQEICFRNGLTSVSDAGLDRSIIELIDSLQRSGKLQIRVNAMINADHDNLEYFLKRKPIKTEHLNVNSYKMYADGALGSRGACLLVPYSDLKGHSGFLVNSIEQMKDIVMKVFSSPYQLNTHCIGDSANRLILKLYAEVLKPGNDRRWRIEHAQVVDTNDMKYFGMYGIIPSVQPTHATSDMYWAEERLGKERVMCAYAYNQLMKQNGWIALGTDFPVEDVNPFYTFYAATERKDGNGFPEKGFQIKNALTREDALFGITKWPAKAAFEELEKGSIEPGKYADFILLDVDLLKDSPIVIRNTKVVTTYLGGKKVY